MENICVAVRVRPSRNEEYSSNGFHWKVESNRISLHRSDDTPINTLSFAFDHVLDQDCSNARVYELLTRNIIHAAVDGFNGTAFAYGQTSSGKTFTMNGSEGDPGIIHRAVKDIFAKIQKTSDREFLIRVSYMEIYNEEINDLFAVENQKLQIHESLDRGVFVAGLREEIVNNADQVLNLIQLGEANRHFGDTNMNARSSRSHTIFRMVIESKVKDDKSTNSDDVIRVSVLNLVDLAGSERVAKTGAGGVRLKEGKHINKSLMILGNVINKLSEGGKQRAHIPYRDSKLTRILQPALGGNAKTSIICTVAPEEIHVEETKGTLQFASRAKRITNCVQVNEILTDGALLKRQKLEIEELRRRLQGSHAEVLEQEVLKLRNDMLKYELEHEKLASELEEERKSQREREQCIREQQMKIDNLSNLVSLSDTDRSTPQDDVRQHTMRQQDTFSTPSYKANSSVFVAKRSHKLPLPESSSPLPDAFSEVVDEDTWAKMNKGFIADLDSLQTPARKVQSFPCSEDYSSEIGGLELQDLQTKLKRVTEERDELKRKHAEQVSFNDQLTREISGLQQEIVQIQEIPRNLHQAVTDCKDMYNGILSILQNFIDDEKSTTSEILSTMSDVGCCLLSNLESHLSMAMDGNRRSSMPDFSTQEQCEKLREKLTRAVSSLVSDSPSVPGDEQREDFFRNSKTKGNLGEQISCWKKAVRKEVNTIKLKYEDLEKELDHKKLLMEISEAKYHSLEREFRLVKEDRDALLQKISDSSQTIAQITGENDRVLKDFNREVTRRKNLEQEIKQFSLDFSSRKKSLLSIQSDFKSTLENMNTKGSTSLTKFPEN